MNAVIAFVLVYGGVAAFFFSNYILSRSLQMEINKPSQLLGVVAWFIVFVMGFCMFMRWAPIDAVAWTLFGIFFFVAVMAAAVAGGRPKRKPGQTLNEAMDADFEHYLSYSGRRSETAETKAKLREAFAAAWSPKAG